MCAYSDYSMYATHADSNSTVCVLQHL